MAMEHTVRAFESELRHLGDKLAEMGGLAERLVGESLEALLRRDTALAERVIETDRQVDRMQRDIEEQAILMIARRQPVASDLREIVSALRIVGDLERIGDYAKNIAKRSLAINTQGQPAKLALGVEHMGELVQQQLKDVLDSYSQRDDMAAIRVWRGDEQIDALYTSLFRELLTYMMEDPRNIGFCTHLLFCAKNIERIGDHSTNIAETVYYCVRGENLVEERPKVDSAMTPV